MSEPFSPWAAANFGLRVIYTHLISMSLSQLVVKVRETAETVFQTQKDSVLFFSTCTWTVEDMRSVMRGSSAAPPLRKWRYVSSGWEFSLIVSIFETFLRIIGIGGIMWTVTPSVWTPIDVNRDKSLTGIWNIMFQLCQRWDAGDGGSRQWTVVRTKDVYDPHILGRTTYLAHVWQSFSGFMWPAFIYGSQTWSESKLFLIHWAKQQVTQHVLAHLQQWVISSGPHLQIQTKILNI